MKKLLLLFFLFLLGIEGAYSQEIEWQNTIGVTVPTNHYQLATDRFGSGIYFVQVTGTSGSYCGKMII